ncbi:helix-turn-helix domain-containing protein [Saccharopolyspora sp. NFXS83]|uniref:helix-turn-helix domain-containing protein n=1 Tax=Saccharopolyspora sp. NFXS83 TaxID=2993560 RepID=UPI00224B53A7|nr:helix-turn-helix domain-containing protein [Saccharopolyspora sp. NFXS83]MCX2732767.1 helix-turn-helix domain-containing protein [Saccharopolyspora sp. NFXS83]
MAQVEPGGSPPQLGFGPVLRRRRAGAGLTQEELARRTGISARAIGDMERGRVARPQARTLRALAAALATDEAELRNLLPRNGNDPGQARTGWGGLLCEPPPETADLAGREQETAALLAVLDGHSSARSAPVVAVTGAPGVGKSTFLVHAGHRLAGRFPGGCFFLSMRRDGRRSPEHALGTVLRALGVATDQLPAGADARSSLYRSLLRDRKVLLLLDDVVDEAQVRPLLPSNPDCLVLLAGARGLAGLESVVRIPLDVLTPAHSVRLLAGIVGTERVRREPSASLALADLCGHLPLALRIAGNRLAGRPRWRVADLLRLLGDGRRRLAALTAGDLRVRTTFEAPYRECGELARAVFRRLALAEEPEITVRRAAALAEVDVDSAERGLEELVDAGLLESAAGTGRYVLRELLRLFAEERLRAEEPGREPSCAARPRPFTAPRTSRPAQPVQCPVAEPRC